MLDINMQLDILAMLTPQVNNHLLSHEKKILFKKKYKNMGGLDQNSYVNKNDP